MTFRVYGMTESKAWQIAKTLPPKNGEEVKDYEERIRERAKKLIDGTKEVPLSGKFDAPQFAREFMHFARKAGRCRNLHIRHPVEVSVVRRGKPATQTVWTEYKP